MSHARVPTNGSELSIYPIDEQLGISDWLNVGNPHGLPGPVRFGIIHSNTPATLSPVSTGDAHNWRVFIA